MAKEQTMAIIPVVENTEITRILKFEDCVQPFLDSCDVRESTKVVYQAGVGRFIKWQKANGIIHPDGTAILAFKTFLIELNLSANTINSILTSVRQFFVFLESKKFYPNVAKGVKALETSQGHLREYATFEQIKEMLAKIDTSTDQGIRNYAILFLMAKNGLRCCEIIRANIGDLKISGDTAKLWIQGKGKFDKADWRILKKECLDVILKYIKSRGKTNAEDPLFPSVSDRNYGKRLTTRVVRGFIKDLFRQIGLDDRKLSAHSIRHFFASEAYKNGAPLLGVSASLGHKSITTTQIYVHQINRVRDAGENFIPSFIEAHP